MDLFHSATARKLRDTGIEAVSAFPNDSYVEKARSVAEMLAAKNGQVTINDVLKALPKPESVHPNALGAIMRSKRLKLVSFTQSNKVSSHARRVGIYEYNPVDKTC